MSSLYILNLPGMSRYDIQSSTLVDNQVTGWQHIRSKLNLTEDELNMMCKLFKQKNNIAAKEIKTKRGTYLSFNKLISSEMFNDFMRNYIQTYKICKSCQLPELCDGNCKSCCRAIVAPLNVIEVTATVATVATVEITVVKTKLTNVEKTELKKQKQRDKARLEITAMEPIVEENDIIQ